MVDFSSVKKTESSFAKRAEMMRKMNAKETSGADERFWTPGRDKAGNGSAVIRFLPNQFDPETFLIQYWEHNFKGPGGWYIEKSLTSIGQPDPVGELNSHLWASTTDDKSPARMQARNQARRLRYVSNIYVLHDSINNENSGKVFLFRYGKQIYNKLFSAMNPRFEDDERLDPFNVYRETPDSPGGANMKIRVITRDTGLGKFPNYEESSFEHKASLFDDQKQIEEVLSKTYDLRELVAPETFKSYDFLKQKLARVLGDKEEIAPSRSPMPTSPSVKLEEDVPWDDSSSTVLEDDEDERYIKELLSK